MIQGLSLWFPRNLPTKTPSIISIVGSEALEKDRSEKCKFTEKMIWNTNFMPVGIELGMLPNGCVSVTAAPRYTHLCFREKEEEVAGSVV